MLLMIACMMSIIMYVYIISIGWLDDLCHFTLVRITQILEGMVNTQGACNNNGHDVSSHYYTLLQALLSKPKFLDRIIVLECHIDVQLAYSFRFPSGGATKKCVCVCGGGGGGGGDDETLPRHQDFFSS